ncbi:MAG: peptide chain release factor 2 [Thermodesulfobacteriota bacterium]
MMGPELICDTLSKELSRLETIFDLETKKERLKELNHTTGQPDFWDDSYIAQKLLKEQAQIKDSIEDFESISSNFEDAELLLTLAEQENDADSVGEAESILDSIQKKVENIEFLRILGEPDDSRNAILSINAGAGGTEAQDWAEMLLRMYIRYAERKGFETKTVEIQDGDEAGIKSATVFIDGEYPFGYLKAENGVHRLVRISPFDSNKRRHTSFASVFVSPEIDDSIEVIIDEKDLRIDTYRASGKGGQHVNKTDSAVRITHLPTNIAVSCQNERSQRQNKESAMKILRARLYEMEKAKKQEKVDEINSTKKEIGWGSQIRSYIMHPYQMVKDHRTDFESSSVDAILDGELDEFIKNYLSYNSSE